MLIREKRPQGSLYPQITHAPTDYFEFLNFFRGGHTIDDNLTARDIASTVQANLLKAAISSGHLTKTKNMANPDDFVADIVLTGEGAEQILTPQDKQYCKLAVELAAKSIAEKDGKPHPYVGAVVVKDGQIIATGYRGETGDGRHAEYCALRKINDDVDNVDLSGCTVYTTLEPCSIRKPGKTPCTNRLIKGKVERVVYGLADKDETVFGHSSLDEASIEVGLFPKTLRQELLTLNKNWSDTRRMFSPHDALGKFHLIKLERGVGRVISGIEFLLASVDRQSEYFSLRMCRINSLLDLLSTEASFGIGSRDYEYIFRCCVEFEGLKLTDSFMPEFNEVWFGLEMVPDITLPLNERGRSLMKYLWDHLPEFLSLSSFAHLGFSKIEDVGHKIRDHSQQASDRLDRSDRIGMEPK
jgi:pyrimidine deaminase RibD-like protein